jgi:hypothetical protein
VSEKAGAVHNDLLRRQLLQSFQKPLLDLPLYVLLIKLSALVGG